MYDKICTTYTARLKPPYLAPLAPQTYQSQGRKTVFEFLLKVKADWESEEILQLDFVFWNFKMLKQSRVMNDWKLFAKILKKYLRFYLLAIK